MYKSYLPDSINHILQKIDPVWCTSDKGEKILNEPISFDIEVSSIYILENGMIMQSNEYVERMEKAIKEKDLQIVKSMRKAKKFAFMYGWTFDIYDHTILGRTWDEFEKIISQIQTFFNLNEKKRIIIYVHNLPYEFQFIRQHFQWLHVFATKERKPIYAITSNGIEFKCSYRLSGYSLRKIGEQIGIEKSSDLDYNKIRHSRTLLTPLEKQYMIIDVKIVSEYIRRKIKEENGIINIPLTKTGYVRRLYRAHCLHSHDYIDYINIMKRLQISLEEYNMMKQAFMGGYTHSNKKYFSKRLENVVSMDLTSSYPTVLVSEKYAMGKGQKYNFADSEEIFEREMHSNEFVYLFEIELENVYPIFFADNYISYSKCEHCEKPVINNGRIYSADKIKITITNIDYQIIEKCYKFDIASVGIAYRYQLDYLPEPFIETIFELYKTKTTLKDVIGKEDEYLSSKENINASFGMCVTDIVRDIISYCTEWEKNNEPIKENKKLTDDEKQKQLDEENNKRGRFLFYMWGVMCTAYARRNLWDAIFELGGDYIYSDTDSVKFINEENHIDFFNAYNEYVTNKINHVLKYHAFLPLEYAHPKTIEGIEKPLGVWDFDGHYSYFKTLGAKRYMLKYSNDKRNNEKKRGKYSITVAGLSKDACKFLEKFENPFDKFAIGLHVPYQYSGRTIHTYIDEPFTYKITDYNGTFMQVFEKSSVHLSPADYELSIAAEYRDFLAGIRAEKMR